MEFTWANGRQLTGVSNGSHTVSYQYDSNSIRTKKTVDGVTTEYFLNGSTVLTQVTGDTQLDFFYDDLGNALGFIRNSTDKYYYIRNLQNDIVGILDSGGTQVVEYAYDTWGKLESITGAMAATIGRENPLRYRGYYYDEETGFYYLQSRYYDPETGRFLNADETVLTGQGITSGNMYAYCGNNPVMNTDPSGRSYYDNYLGNASQRYAQSMGLSTPSSLNTPASQRYNAYINSGVSTPQIYTRDYQEGKVYIVQPDVQDKIYPSKKDVVIVDYRSDPNPTLKVMDTYKISDKKQKKEIIKIMVVYNATYPVEPTWERTEDSLYTEWGFHNFAYALGYKRDRTADTDFDNADEGKGFWDFVRK